MTTKENQIQLINKKIIYLFFLHGKFFRFRFAFTIETKMTTISVQLVSSQDRSHQTFDLEDLNLTEQQWEQMSDLERQDAVQRAVDDLPEHPYWVVRSFN